ncbi:hypothetical protein VTO58DRAFT_102524 [Aureobasidium pullulans]
MEDLLVVPDTLDFHAECRAVDFSPIFRTRRDIHNHEPCQRKNIIDNHGHLTEGYDCFERHDEGNSDGDDNEYGDHGNTDGEDNSDEEDNSDSDWDGSDVTDDGNYDSSDYDSEDDYPSENDSKPTYREWIDYEPSIIPYFHLILNRHPHRRAQVPNNSGSWSPRCYWLEDLEDSLYSDDEESDTDEDDSENDSSEDSQPPSSSPSDPAAQTSTTTTGNTLLVTIAHSFCSLLSCGMLLPLLLISPFLWISKRYFHIG